MNGKKLGMLLTAWSFVSASVMAQLGIPTVKCENKEKSIELQDLKIDVEVVGNIATTTFDMTFFNSGSRVMEGEFEFPLGEGQTVSRYALDIDGKLREGVVVEKEKGRVAFESKVRQNVDPGLLEMTAGNNFRTRIYPFNPNGTRHIVVACEQELKTDNGKRYYRLPISTSDTIKNLAIEIKAYREFAEPKVSSESMGDIYFKPNDNDSYVASLKRENVSLNKGLFFELPSRELPTVYTENVGMDTYFYLYSSMTPVTVKKAKPKSLAVVYDVSGSSENRNLKKDYDLLKSYLDYLGITQFHLITFSHKKHADKQCDINGMKSIINPDKPNFDGATQIGCVDLSKIKEDEILFFSDGLGNIGSENIPSTNKSVVVVNSSAVADHSFLKYVAQKSGGSYINLCNKTQNEALGQLCNVQYNFIRAEYDGQKISEVYPSMPTPVTGSFSMSGIMKSKEADITLYFGLGNTVKDKVVCHISAIEEENPTVKPMWSYTSNRGVANNVKRMWAQKKLAELDIQYEKNKQIITNLSKKYGIVTRNTSLIVLETVEDYVRYEITPPDEFKEEYFRLMASKPKTIESTDITEYIISIREAFVSWWKTDFSKIKKEKEVEIRIAEDDRSVQVEESAFFDVEDEPVVAPGIRVVENDVESRSIEEVEESSASTDSRENRRDADDGDVATMQIQYWNPDVPYLSKLKSVEKTKMYDAYLEMKPQYSSSPSFYLDVAGYFNREKLNDEAIRIVSNLAEMKLDDAEVARSCANKLVEFKSYKLAASVLERVVDMRSEEAQSYRDLALVYWELGRYQEAADLLYKVGTKQWDSRFTNIQQIAINELNALIALNPGKVNTSKYDKRLLGNCPVDIRIILTWNTNDCDLDLWVTDPNGEKCYFQNKNTAIGGRMSDDITSGYGPEEFCVKKAKAGNYKIEANYYGTRSQKRLQPVVAQATVYTNFGRPNQKKEVLTLQLGHGEEVATIGNINFKK